MPKLRLLLASSSVLALVACGGGPQDHELALTVSDDEKLSFLADKPAPTHRLYERVLIEGERNAVLNHMRAGLAAMEIGAHDQAARSFDQAMLKIETVYADNAAAEEARSNFTKENIKEFKGEGYERAMAFYYRGLLYMMEGDYENARASFKGGVLQDSFAEDQIYATDFASLEWLQGWAVHCMGRSATEDFARASTFRPALSAPAPDANLLVIVESGTAPTKFAMGEHNEQLHYFAGVIEPNVGSVWVGEQALPLTLAEDLYWQATTRGGRQVDVINAGKAEFKESTETASQVAGGIAQGASQASLYGLQSLQNGANYSEGVANTSLGLAGLSVASSLAGGIFGAISSNVTPEADIRYWDNLPGTIHGVATTVAAMPKTVLGPKHGQFNQDIEVHSNGSCGFAWTRTVSALAVPDSAPNAIHEEL